MKRVPRMPMVNQRREAEKVTVVVKERAPAILHWQVCRESMRAA